jgi:hypothetical protein
VTVFKEKETTGKGVMFHLGMFAYNCFRLIGRLRLTGELAPVRHSTKRRRIKTVLQELMYCAAKFISARPGNGFSILAEAAPSSAHFAMSRRTC